jgi:hypothetical protein
VGVVGTEMVCFALGCICMRCMVVFFEYGDIVRTVGGWAKRKARCGDMIDWVFDVLKEEKKKLVGVVVLFYLISGIGGQVVYFVRSTNIVAISWHSA